VERSCNAAEEVREARLSISDQMLDPSMASKRDMFESLASCSAFRCSATLNSPQDESAVADMTPPFVDEL
jgi:hypothetical protein